MTTNPLATMRAPLEPEKKLAGKLINNNQTVFHCFSDILGLIAKYWIRLATNPICLDNSIARAAV